LKNPGIVRAELDASAIKARKSTMVKVKRNRRRLKKGASMVPHEGLKSDPSSLIDRKTRVPQGLPEVISGVFQDPPLSHYFSAGVSFRMKFPDPSRIPEAIMVKCTA
jgi:hypothetical protein